MKSTLLALTLTLCLTSSAWAQDNPSDSTPPPPPGNGHHFGGLTEDERTELKAAHDAAVQANPDLVTQEKQLRDGWKDYEQKMHDAMVKADPKIEPILAKMHHHHGPPPGAPEDGGGSQ